MSKFCFGAQTFLREALRWESQAQAFEPVAALDADVLYDLTESTCTELV